jgi:hypothetical protein
LYSERGHRESKRAIKESEQQNTERERKAEGVCERLLSLVVPERGHRESKRAIKE